MGNEDTLDPPLLQMLGVSTEIMEVTASNQHWCRQDLVLHIPPTTLEVHGEDSVTINVALMPCATPKRDVPILIIVSMLSYFCFLEQLLVRNLGSGAIGVCLPFSCILGVFATVTSTTMVRRNYAWIYAAIQFGLVVSSAHLFYSLIHMQAVFAVLLSTFVGFGLSMCGASLLNEILMWRRRSVARHNEQHLPPDEVQPQPSLTVPQPLAITNSSHDATEP